MPFFGFMNTVIPPIKNKTMVNNIDVSDCEFLVDKNKIILCKAYSCMPKSVYCEAHPDCYFKRLKK